jgi:hypothetical protein
MPLKVDKLIASEIVLNGTELTGVLPYKVYTALLTQSGQGNTTGINSGPLTKGVTYKIQAAGGDFSNVGAPNNNPDTYFVAINNDTPLSYGGSTLLYNTGAPEVTVLENTIGNIWFTYIAQGVYLANSVELFTQNKIWATAYSGSDDETIFVGFVCANNGTSEISLYASNGSNQHINIRLEIRVYN